MRKLWLILLVSGIYSAPSLAQVKSDRLKVTLSRAAFSDTFFLLFKTGGNDKTDDQDAPKISDGYLSVAGLSAAGLKIAIEEKAYPAGPQVIQLYTSVYAAGTYDLNLQWADEEKAGLQVSLYDHLLELKIPFQSAAHHYPFHIDTSQLSQTQRFSLLLETRLPTIEPELVKNQTLMAYPNPFINQLFLQVKDFAARAELQLTDMMGRKIWRKSYTQVQPMAQLEIPVQQLTPGLYLLNWRDLANPKAATTLKIIKQ